LRKEKPKNGDADMSDNLTTIKNRFSATHRVERDECGDYQIPLKAGKGHVYAHSRSILAAYIMTDKPTTSLKTIKKKCPKASVHVCGDYEVIILYPVKDAKEFLRACGARTKKRLSDEHKQKLASSSKEFRFRSACKETQT